MLRIILQSRRVPDLLPDRVFRVRVPPYLPSIVDREDCAVGLEQDHDFERRFEDRPKLRFAEGEFGSAFLHLALEVELSLLRDGDVGRRADESAEFPVRSEAR